MLIMRKILNYFPYLKITEMIYFIYSPFRKTLPRSRLQTHWISVSFYEMGDTEKGIL